MIGQMTYIKSTKSWRYTPRNKLTVKICRQNNKIQSRGGYYVAWSRSYINGGTLDDMIAWVEKTAC